MSEEKQRLVSAALQQEPLTARSRQVPLDTESLSEARRRLASLQFTPQQIDAAVAGIGGLAADYYTDLLDWLLLNMPNDQLPAKLRASSTTNAVNVLAVRSRDVAGSTAARTTAAAVPAVQEDAATSSLAAAGFLSAEVHDALEACNRDVLLAHVRLYAGLTGIEMVPHPSLAGTSEGGSQSTSDSAWDEEKTVLEAIYGDDVSYPSPHTARIKFALPSDPPAHCMSGLGDASTDTVELTFIVVEGVHSYPEKAPLISLCCSVLVPGVLRYATRQLAAQSQSLLGQPMLHDFISHVSELLMDLENAQLEPDAQASFAGISYQTEESSAADAESVSDVLNAGFSGLAMDDEGDVACLVAAPEPRSQAVSGQQRRRQGAPQLNTAAESARLQRHQQELDSSPSHAGMRRTRGSLPAASKRSELLALMERRLVVVISGSTGKALAPLKRQNLFN